jgi:hypothetical protein
MRAVIMAKNKTLEENPGEQLFLGLEEPTKDFFTEEAAFASEENSEAVDLSDAEDAFADNPEFIEGTELEEFEPVNIEDLEMVEVSGDK